MKFDDMEFSLSAVQWLVMIVIGVYTWLVQRASASNAEVVALRERLVVLEVEVKNMPSEATVRELISQLSALAAHGQGTKQQLEAVQQSVNRINDFLLNQR